jgi:hypothetical protein
MGHSGELSIDGKLWVMPLLLEAFGWALAFKSVDAFYDHRRWAGYGVSAIVLIVGGGVWIAFRKRIAAWWGSWRGKKTAAVRSQVVTYHNVQFTGFVPFDDDDFVTATLSFRNVPNGKLLGKFERPRLRVIYYNQSTGEEIADMSPAEWWNGSGIVSDIGSQEECAVVASFTKGLKMWRAVELYENESTGLSLRSEQLPTGEIHIVASLIGANDVHVPTIRGTLTLSEDGSVSFQITKGFIQAI